MWQWGGRGDWRIVNRYKYQSTTCELLFFKFRNRKLHFLPKKYEWKGDRSTRNSHGRIWIERNFCFANLFFFVLPKAVESLGFHEKLQSLSTYQKPKNLQLLSRSNRVSLGGPGKFKMTNWASCDLFTITSFNLTAVCIRRTLSSSL